MADLRESFPGLEDVTSKEGKALGARVEGETPVAVNGAIGFSFKDSAGNVVLPQLNANGELAVSEGAGVSVSARGTAAGSGTLVTVATLTLTVDAIYDDIEFVCSSFRDSRFQLVFNDNASESILADSLVGPGCMTANICLNNVNVVAGSTGTQELLVKALNNNALSDFYATVSCKEIV